MQAITKSLLKSSLILLIIPVEDLIYLFIHKPTSIFFPCGSLIEGTLLPTLLITPHLLGNLYVGLSYWT